MGQKYYPIGLMPLIHFGSPHLQSAKLKLASAKNTAFSLEEREKRAIELAADMLRAANSNMSFAERKIQKELGRMMRDPKGKAFTMLMTDQCFRSNRSSRVANQLVYLLKEIGIPEYLGWSRRVQLQIFRLVGKAFAFLFVPLARRTLRKATERVILPGEPKALKKHLKMRYKQGVRLNLNHLGEAILGEKEADTRLMAYLSDLQREDIEYVSIKISTIYSQIQLLSWEHSIDMLADRLRQLYRTAMRNPFVNLKGERTPKFVNLDMEEYRDLLLTKELFKKVLNEKEFFSFSAGIVLQAYLPDSHEIQKELTTWALERVSKGGAPIKIRIVKGANLAMEQFDASVHVYEQAPYKTKTEVDANYKKMVTFGALPPHAKAVHLGIASHNLFDIAYAMLLRVENGTEKEISFEMLEGMADHMRRVVHQLTGSILLYCPVARKEDFQSAIAYLIRRLDENTGPENFLRSTFGLTPASPDWHEQASLFSKACSDMGSVSLKPRRTQNRNLPTPPIHPSAPFENEPDTDFSLTKNRLWAQEIVEKWQKFSKMTVPLIIKGGEVHAGLTANGYSPADLETPLYSYSLASSSDVDGAIRFAKEKETQWRASTIQERCSLLSAIAHKMREKRADLIGVMMADGGKTVIEADVEISEAIDFAEYYSRSLRELHTYSDIEWKPRGTILITPPWNFPISIPAGGILAALATGNCVLFKPAPEAVLSGYFLAKLLYEAGVSKDVLQFFQCVDDPVGSQLIADPRINGVILTGATATAELFLKLNPTLNLNAETGGKNAIIITGMSDRDLAIKDLVHSAFGHSGQKCSACSLAILEKEVYEDPLFKKQLKDAVESLSVGISWDTSTKVVPLIRPPGEELLRGLTTLEPGEEWLVEPKQDPRHPNLFTPGVKWGVKPGSFMHTTELFGPVLGVMCAKNLKQALNLANSTRYGLTSGLQSLDPREQKLWLSKIEAGNCYINRTITGAIVQRQPFGGTKASHFGHGAKAGGPNYLYQFMKPSSLAPPQGTYPLPQSLEPLLEVAKQHLSPQEFKTFTASCMSYALFADRFKRDEDKSLIVGQDNFLRFVPQKNVALRIDAKAASIDVFCSFAAILCCQTPVFFSFDPSHPLRSCLKPLYRSSSWHKATTSKFLSHVREGMFRKVRLLNSPDLLLFQAAATNLCYLATTPVLFNGRFELLHYLREVAISTDYHRYGNLNLREGEKRSPIK